MTDTPDSPATATRSKRGTLLVVGSILLILASLFYLEKLPSFLYWPMRLLFVASVLWLAFATFQAIRSTKFEAKRVVFSLVLMAFMYGALFLICSVFVKLMSAKDDALTTVGTSSLTEKSRRGVNSFLTPDHPVAYDREVGWVQRPSYAWKGHSTTEQGLRGTRIYPETPADPEKRILCVGDSFTYGYEVGDTETFPYHGEQLVAGSEWINLGICGGGLTQSLMQYRKNGRKFGGKYVVIAFMTNNNKRTVNCFRPFVSPDDPMTPLTKPFAKFADGKFSLEPNPYQDIEQYRQLLADESGELAMLYQLDYFTWSNQKAATNPVMRTLSYIWERRYGERNLGLLLNRPVDDSYGKFRASDDPYGTSLWHPKSPGFQAITQVFDVYHADVVADGRVPLIVILPSAGDVEERAKGRSPKHAALLAHLDAKGYHYFDFLDTLEEHRKDSLTKEALYVNTHFNSESNELIAEEIIKAFSLR